MSAIQEHSVSSAPLVLVVDDVEDNRTVCRDLLTSMGFRVTEASGGQEALRLAEELRPNLVIMDLAMPGMDGYEATRRLKAAPATREIPIVVLTAHTLPSVEREARRAGCDAFLRKPCAGEEIERALQELIGAPPI